LSDLLSVELDNDGYPTEETIGSIKFFTGGFEELLSTIAPLFAEYGQCEKNKELCRWVISTGGWSGNEEVVRALQQNHWFWVNCWYRSTRGGHYQFTTSR